MFPCKVYINRDIIGGPDKMDENYSRIYISKVIFFYFLSVLMILDPTNCMFQKIILNILKTLQGWTSMLKIILNFNPEGSVLRHCYFPTLCSVPKLRMKTSNIKFWNNTKSRLIDISMLNLFALDAQVIQTMDKQT